MKKEIIGKRNRRGRKANKEEERVWSREDEEKGG